MKRYIVESRRDYTEIFDNYVFVHIDAENEYVALATYKKLLLDAGLAYVELDRMEFRVKEVGQA